jgi:large subunit ribosomal protein L29
MSLIRSKEIREMSKEEREAKLKELRNELMHERGVAAMGGAPPNPGKIKALRTQVARMLTIMKEEEEEWPEYVQFVDCLKNCVCAKRLRESNSRSRYTP